jgi:predicted DNA-binding ribbon-helix-helix protein
VTSERERRASGDHGLEESLDPGRPKKRSITIAGHKTSVSLEAAFWSVLRRLAGEEGLSLAALVAKVDAGRGEANLSSALRVYALERAVMRPPDGAAGRPTP